MPTKIVSLTVDKRRRLKGLSARVGLTFAVLTFSFALVSTFASPISAQSDTEDDPSPPSPFCRLIGIEIFPSELTVRQGESAKLNFNATFSPTGCADNRDISPTWWMTNEQGSFQGPDGINFLGIEEGAGRLGLTASLQGDDEIMESIPFVVLRPYTGVTILSEKFYEIEKAPDAIQNNAICKGKDACIYILAGDSVKLAGRVENQLDEAWPRWRIEDDNYNIASLSSTDSLSTRLSTVPEVAQITTLTVWLEFTLDNTDTVSQNATIIVVPIRLGVQLGRCSASLYRYGTQYYALTAGHCLTSGVEVEGYEQGITERVELSIGGARYDGVLVGIDEATDLAVVLVRGYDNADLPDTRLYFNTSVNDTVYAVGYPGLEGEYYADAGNLVVTSAEVTEIVDCGFARPISDKRPVIGDITTDGSIGDDCLGVLIDATPNFVAPGSSGGPSVNESGEIMGIASTVANDHSHLAFFRSMGALDWFLDSNRRCFSNFYFYTDTEIDSTENEAIRDEALMDVEVGNCDENPKVTRVVYLQSADTPWWVYVVVVASMATLLLISISIRSRLRRRRLVMLRKGEIIVPRDELAKRVWEDHYGKATRTQDICTAWMVKEDYGYASDYGWEIDYIVPLSHGGTNRFDNLRPLHWMNKAAKGDNLDGEWECAIRYESDRTDTVDRDFTIPL